MRARSPNEVLNWLVVLLAFAIPLYRAWVSLAAYLILILWFFQGDIRDRVDRLGRHRLTIAILVFMGLNLVSLLWSEDPSGGFEYWRKYIYLLLAPAVASSLRPGVARQSLIAFLVGTVLSVLIMPVVIFGDIHIRHIHPGNPAATMSHLDYSMVLAVAALLLLVAAVDRPPPTASRRWLATAAFLVIMAGLVVNIGRSGQFAFAASLIVLLPVLLHRRSWIVRAAVFAVIVVVIAGAYLAAPRFSERAVAVAVELREAIDERRMDSNQGKRVAGAVVALDIVGDHPVLGTGIGGNMIEFRRKLDTDYPEFRDAVGWFPHLHNQYLQVATEAGVVGLASMLAIFAALVLGRYRHAEMRSFAVAVACVYLFGFFGDPFLHKQLTVVLFALAAGVISADDEAFAST